ncbi:MAG TPA: OstA-like protein [Ferruginibacter sp.]|nr:OstA-like protein [Ferruginibacter sp.]
MILKQHSYLFKIILFAAGLFFMLCSNAQVTPIPVTPPAAPGSDTTTEIEIIWAENMRTITMSDGTELQTLAGKASVKQGKTKLTGDSIVLNSRTGIAEVFGNVHINDADTVNTYSSYLKYLGRERIAFLKKNVKLTDGRATLLTDDLEYNLATGIATYKDGGKVVNGKTILTSSDAVYYSDTKDVYFKKYVHLTDPQYDIVADSLMYNTQFKTATFISPTRIKTKEGGIINTKSGTYNLETREAIFYDRTSYNDSTRSLTGGKIAYDEKSGILQVEENGKLVDSVNNVTVLGGQILLDKIKNSFLATRKPVMILYRGNDSTYIAADTLFSGIRKYDTTKNATVLSNDTINKVMAVNLSTSKTPDSIRYFIAFNNVKIFNDSLQALCDSLYYSTEDSVFRMFRDPVFWNDKTQVSGDTIYLFTKNQKAERLYVFNNGMVVNQSNDQLYNQMAGRTLNGYFTDGNIDYIRVKGSPAESIFYPLDEDSAYVGMNRSSGDVIDIYFVNKELNKVKFINDVNGTLFPLKQIPAGEDRLKGFEWMDKRRPKNKLELFE